MVVYFIFEFREDISEFNTYFHTLSLHVALPIYMFFLFNVTGHMLHILAQAFYDCHFCGTVVVVYRSEEHTSVLQSRDSISYAVFCLKKKNSNCCQPFPPLSLPISHISLNLPLLASERHLLFLPIARAHF